MQRVEFINVHESNLSIFFKKNTIDAHCQNLIGNARIVHKIDFFRSRYILLFLSNAHIFINKTVF